MEGNDGLPLSDHDPILVELRWRIRLPAPRVDVESVENPGDVVVRPG
jgi:hypothetical protein